MALKAGSRLGPYEILAAVGAGGMGEVYRARDPKLERTVAVKVLSPEYAGDRGRLARFEQEARSASALNHPNIVTIYDIGQADSTAYIAMEYVEGRTLRELVEGGALPLKKALGIAAQVADGLAKAHQAGLVHLDLKPENVMVTGDGLVKILDFGLVKLAAATEGSGLTATAVAPATHPGMVLGTVGYMSPEQARGREVDYRSDQFALGTLLYEMLTGKRPFQRESSAQTMAAIIEDEPRPVTELNPKVPAPARWIVERCLAKEPEERYASTRDLARDLQRVRDHLSEASMSSQFGVVAAPGRTGTRRLSPAMAGVIALLALAAGVVLGRWSAPKGSGQPTAIRTLTFSGMDTDPSVSRDGKMVAFTSQRDGKSRIWVKQLPGAGEAPLTTGPGDSAPRFSPDGSGLLFMRQEGGESWICRTALVGGETKKLVRGVWADWSPDGMQIAFLDRATDPGAQGTRVGISDPDGSRPRIVRTVAAELTGIRWSPDGKWLAAVTREFGLTSEAEKIVLISADGQQQRTIQPIPGGDTSNLAWVGPGEILYARARQTTASGVSNVQTPTSVVRQNIRTGEQQVLLWMTGAVLSLDTMPGGGIVFDALSGSENVRDAALRGGQVDLANERWLTQGNSSDRQPVYSPNGEWVAFSSNRSGNLDIWEVSTKTGEVRRLTDDPADDWDPAFTRDGKELVYSSHRSGNFEIWVADADGSGARQLTHDGVDAENPIPTKDGWVIYNSGNPAHHGIWKIRLDGSEAQAVPGVVGDWPEVSPDGQYVMITVHGQTAASLAVHRISDGAQVMNIKLNSLIGGRSGFMPDGHAIIFSDSPLATTPFKRPEGVQVFVQEFSPGQDTSATRRQFFAVKQGGVETFSIAPDGSRVVYSVTHISSSLWQAEGVAAK